MCWTVRGSNPGVMRFSAPLQAGPGTDSASCTMGFWFLLGGGKRQGRDVDNPLLSGAEVKERVELYFYSTSVPSWPVLLRTLPISFFKRGVVNVSVASLCSKTSLSLKIIL